MNRVKSRGSRLLDGKSIVCVVAVALLFAVACQSPASAAVEYKMDLAGSGAENWLTAGNWIPSGPPGSLVNPDQATDDIVFIGTRPTGGNFDVNINNVDVGTVAQVTVGGGDKTNNNQNNRPRLRVYGTNGQLTITGDLILGGVGGSSGTAQFEGEFRVGNGGGTGGRGLATIGGNVMSASTADNDLIINAGGSSPPTEGWGLTLEGDIDPTLDATGAHEIDLLIQRGRFTWNGTTANIEDFQLNQNGGNNVLTTDWILNAGQTVNASARGSVARTTSASTEQGSMTATLDINGTFNFRNTGAVGFSIATVDNDTDTGLTNQANGTVNVGDGGIVNVNSSLVMADVAPDTTPGSQIARATLNLDGGALGAVNALGGIQFGGADDEFNASTFSEININSGTMTVKGDMVDGPNQSTINLLGGTLHFADSSAGELTVDSFSMDETAVLQMTFAGGTPLTASSVEFLSDSPSSTVIDLVTPTAASNPLAEIYFTEANGNSWVDTLNWDPEVLPADGAGFLSNGTTYTLIESTGGNIVNQTSAAIDAGDTDWTIDLTDTTKIQALYSGATQGFGPAAAVIGEYDSSAVTAARDTTLTIGNTVDVATFGTVDAARLIVQDAAFLNVDDPTDVDEPDLIIVANSATDLPQDPDTGQTVLNSADVNVTGLDSTLTVSGNLIYGGGTTPGDPNDPLTFRPGGILRIVDDGALSVGGSIVEGLADGTPDPTVDSAQLFLDGGFLDVAGDITVQSFRVADGRGTFASFTLETGKNLTNTGSLIVANRGTGTFINDGGTVTSLNDILIGDNVTEDGNGILSASNGTYTQNSGTTIVGEEVADPLDPESPTAGGGIDLGNNFISADSDVGANGTLNLNGGEMIVWGGGLFGAQADFSTTAINIGVGGGNPTLKLGKVGRGGGGNLEVANDGTGTFTMESGTIYQNTNNFVVANNTDSVGTAVISGGVYDLRGEDSSRTDSSIVVSNDGTGDLTINGTATVYVSNDVVLNDSNNGGGTFTLDGTAELYIRDDFDTRNNGTDTVNILGGQMIFGRSSGLFAGGEPTNTLNFGTGTNQFNWTGGTIVGLDEVTGIANLADAGQGAGKFYQQGGTLAVTTGSTAFDGDYVVKNGSTITANLVVGTEIGSELASAAIVAPSLVVDPTAEGAVNLDLDVVTAGNISDLAAVTFDNGAGTATWDANATNWSSDQLPAEVIQTVSAGIQWTVAATGAAIAGGTGGTDPLGSLNSTAGFTLSLEAGGDPSVADSQLVATLDSDEQVTGAVQAVIDGLVSTPVARTSDLRIDAGYNPEGEPIDAAALRIQNAGTLNISGITSPNLILGGIGGGVVYHDDGTINVDGDLLFDGTGSVYNLTGGLLNVTGQVRENPAALTVTGSRLNFDGGTLTKDPAQLEYALDIIGVAAGEGTTYDFTLNDLESIVAESVYVGEFGTGSMTVGNDDADAEGATITIDGGAQDLLIGSQLGSSGVVTVNANSTVTVDDDIFLGMSSANDGSAGEPDTGGGEGTLTVNADATVTSTDQLRIGTGTLTVNGGTVTVGGTFATSDGPDDVSMVDVLSGSLTTGNAFIGDDAGDTGTNAPGTGVATMNIGVGGGAPAVSMNQLSVGQWSPGTVTMDSGTLDVTGGNFTVVGRGVDGVGDPVGSTFTLNGGTMNVGDGVTSRDTIIGDTAEGDGTLILNAGIANFYGEVRVGDELGGKGTIIVGQGGGAPTVYVGAAGVDNDRAYIGAGGEGVFEMYSGSWTSETNFVQGQDVYSKSTVTIEGGTLDTTGLAGTATGQWNINFGTGLYVGNQSIANIRGGTVKLGGAFNLTNETGSESIVTIGDDSGADPLVTIGINLIRTGDDADTDGINYRDNPGFLGGDIVNFRSGTLDVTGGNINPGTSEGVNEFNWTGGTLKNVGTFDGDLAQGATTAASTLIVGGSVGAMVVNGAYSIDGTGNGATLQMEIEGTAGAGVAGGHDQMTVNGTATLGANSTLEVLADPYAGPTTRGTIDEFVLVGADSLSGTFNSASYNGEAIQDASFTILAGTAGQFARMKYTSTEASLQAYFAQQGDLNGSLAVDNSDFGIFAANYNPAVGGKNWNQGDLNGDGFVNDSDFGIFAANFGWMYTGPLELDGGAGGGGEVALGSGLTAVPEPNTMALLAVLGLAGAVALRRRRKSRS